jgi:hypothetical protein
MKVLKNGEIASIKFFHIEVSEDELDVYERALSYILNNVPKDDLMIILGDDDGMITVLRDDLSELLTTYTDLRSS